MREGERRKEGELSQRGSSLLDRGAGKSDEEHWVAELERAT